jgi:DNA-binding GntR family transcriptional regulator
MASRTITGFARLRKRESLRDSVGNALRAAIVSGAMRPGEVHSAPAIGNMLGVSPTPVREAMLDLVREGMVEALPNKGYRVTEISDADLDAIAAVRQLLEPPVVGEITPNVPAEELPPLRKLAQAIVEAVDREDLVGYIEADRVFHLSLLEHASNPVLSTIVSDLRSRTRLLGLKPLLESGRLQASAAEHHELLDLIEARDASAAEALMHRHIAHVRSDWAGPRSEHAADSEPGA